MKRTKQKESLRGIKEIRAGEFMIRVQMKDPRTGNVLDVRRHVHCQTMKEAAAKQVALRAELERGAPAPDRVKVRTYATSWLTGRLPTLKPSTQARYADSLERHILPDLGEFYLDALEPADIHAWFAKKASALAGSTVNGLLGLLKTILADAVAQYGLPRDPTRRVKAVPNRHEAELESDEPVNMLEPEEMGRFLAALREHWPQWFALVFTQFSTARRFGEVSALRWEDIDEEKRVISIRRAQWRGIVSTPKTNRVVRVPLTDELRDVLREWRQELVRSQHRHLHTGWVFPSDVGKPHIVSSVMRKAFLSVLEEIGVARRFSSHGLRRTANNLLRQIATSEVTRAITGHMTVAMTEHYSHVNQTEKRAAVEGMLRLVTPVPGPKAGQG